MLGTEVDDSNTLYRRVTCGCPIFQDEGKRKKIVNNVMLACFNVILEE